MKKQNDIFDNTLPESAKALLRASIGKELVAWWDDDPFERTTEASSGPQVILDFGSYRIYPFISDHDSIDPMFEDVEKADVLSEEQWKALCATGEAGWGQWIRGKDESGNEIYEPVVPSKRPVGRRVEGITLFVDEKTAWYKHDDGNKTYFHDACAIVFHFADSVLVFERIAAWEMNWSIEWQFVKEPILRGERAPGALRSERL